MFLPSLYAETLRSNVQSYFEALQWEQWDQAHISSPIEPYSMTKRKPIAYAQTISETAVYPSLPSLGLLDYNNVSKEILQFYDIITAGFLKKKLDSGMFNPQKPFLVHLVHFILDKLPKAVYVFYGKPIFSQEDVVHVDFKMITEEWVAFKRAENQQQDTQSTPAVTSEKQKVNLTQKSIRAGNHSREKKQHLIPPLFSGEQPYAVIIEVAAIKKGKRWYIDHIDIKGAEYANSSFEN